MVGPERFEPFAVEMRSYSSADQLFPDFDTVPSRECEKQEVTVSKLPVASILKRPKLLIPNGRGGAI